MAFGLGVLRLPPAAFWAMTLRELAAALRQLLPPASIGRAELLSLQRRYPD